MSMIGVFIPVSTQQLNEYLEDSSLFEDSLDIALEEEEENPDWLNIDKSWDALSFMLTGFVVDELPKAAPPLSWVIFGARLLDPEQDLGYGPAGCLTANQVKELNTFLSGISRTQFRQVYNGAKMTELEIYPNIWDGDETIIDYLTWHFERLKAFYARAAAANHAVIFYLS